MTSINVLSRTQRIVVDSNFAISIVNAGPPGPSGINGVSPEVDMYVLYSPVTDGDKGILALVLDDDDEYSALHTDLDGNLKVVGPLSDIELRATPVPVSGTVSTGGLTDAELRADPVVISGEVSTGALTDDELRAVPVVISGSVSTGGITDDELRATAVVVSTGGVTDDELRATPVAVSTGISQPLTDSELRNAPVLVSGSVTTGGITDTQLRATPVLVSGSVTTGGLTDAQLRNAPVPISGSVSTGDLTDTQLRATPVPISGSVSTGDLTNAQLRATPVPVSGTVALDAPSLAALENTTITIDAASLAALETINVSNLASTEFPEDSPHTNGDAGSLALAVRRDADTPSVSSDGDYSALHTDSTGKLKVAGPLTDTQLRDTPVPISGTVLANTGLAQAVTDTQLRATPIPVSGPVTDTQLRATPVPVSGTVTATTGGLTDTQLRATPVPVSGTVTASGPVTDAQLRATPVPISGTVSTGAVTDAQLRATPLPISGTVSTGAVTDAQLRATPVPVSGTVTATNAGNKVEDAASVDGDTGTFILAVRRDADTSSVGTDGDYAALLVDSIGRLKVKSIKDNQIVNGTITIASGASVSSTGGDANNGIIDLRAKSLVGLQMPSAWTAAALTFSVSMDGGTTYNDLYDDTMTERSIAVVASRAITVDPTKFMGCTHLKIRSGTGASAVNQGAARTLIYTTIAL